MATEKKKISARAKGNSFELACIKKLKEIGFTECASTRSCNRWLDSQKVDIVGVKGWNIQCKAVEKLGSIHAILESMPKTGKNVVLHKKNRQGVTATMPMEVFLELLALSIDRK